MQVLYLNISPYHNIMENKELILGYWNTRGLAEPIRLLLEHLGVHYSEESYELGNAPDFNPEQWMSKRSSLGLDFPNLPYLIDGSLKLTECLAIMRYICHKYDPKLLGTKLEEQANVDMLAGVLYDLNGNKSKLMYAKDLDKLMFPSFMKEKVDNAVKNIAKALETRKHVADDKLTFVDFYCVEILESINDLMEPIFTTYPILGHYYKEMMSLPNVHKYRNSDKFLKNPKPYNNKIARLGSTPVKKDPPSPLTH
eukprot:TRINITY_DN8913_c0_g1_i4.p1 TRINITY_DN8913_c0_g1~~TRINITY_DN8913_c0_g1_i4.p1  ORF type:complete len:254 (-),score=84.64 TRINITY_DN8913_c0_g1_i4:108-869(-)